MTTSTAVTAEGAATAAAGRLAVTAWRDYDPAACALPGMALGERVLAGPVAEECGRLWSDGVRRVRLAGTVDLAAAATGDGALRAVRQLSLVRDLTARAVLVEWALRPPADGSWDWRALGHLQPPQELPGLPAATAQEWLGAWRAGHYVGLCLWRQGPGFVQIRDRRWGGLARFTVDEPHFHEAIGGLAYGAEPKEVPADALSAFEGERLVLPVGPLRWWAPYRVVRWSRGGIMV